MKGCKKRKKSKLDLDFAFHEAPGYVIFPGALIDHLGGVLEIFRSIVYDRALLIFNNGQENNGDPGDGKRSQAALGVMDQQHPCIRLFLDALSLFLSGLFPSHVMRDPVILRSDAGCQAQRAHCDYCQDDLRLVHSNDEMPFGCLVCLEEDTYLDVWPWTVGDGFWNNQEAGYSCRRLKLFPGDVLIFRGDLVHGGSAYVKDNIRFHCFLDHPSAPRSMDTTFYMDQDPRIFPRTRTKNLV